MIRILHLSDLHFGRDRAELLSPLLSTIEALAPDAVAVSGDLTQRARDRQFAAARAFLDRLPAPWLCVPGNHDIPLENAASRLIRPYRAYRRALGRDLEPELRVGHVRLIGVNTVSPTFWQRGAMSPRRVHRACQRLRDGRDGDVSILVAHHPFTHGGPTDKDLMRGADRALDALTGAGMDVALSGHLHVWRVAPHAMQGGRAAALQVQVGTSLSSRVREEPNDFAVLDVEGGALRVARMAWRQDGAGFEEISALRWAREEDGRWAPRSAAAPGDAARPAAARA